MKPPPFDYHAPDSLAEAVALLGRLDAEGRDAKVLAGGQSLMPMLAMRVARPEVLVDLRKLRELDFVRDEGERIAIGAMTSKQAIVDSPLVRQRQPLLHAATELVGHIQIRNRGSVGGSFAHADPAAEYPAVALVLDIEMVAHGAGGRRVIAASDFFVTFMTTSLEPGEILTEVRVPVAPPGRRWAIQEFVRRNGDLALAGIALAFDLQGGLCSNARIAAFGVQATAVRLTAAEQLLEGRLADAASFDAAGRAAAGALEEPMSCMHASSDYRRHLVGTLTTRALDEAARRAP